MSVRELEKTWGFSREGLLRWTGHPGQDTVSCTEVWEKRVPFGGAVCRLVGRQGEDCVQCFLGRLATRWVRPPYTLRMLTKWSYPTRLETRIKESNIHASAEVANLHA